MALSRATIWGLLTVAFALLPLGLLCAVIGPLREHLERLDVPMVRRG